MRFDRSRNQHPELAAQIERLLPHVRERLHLAIEDEHLISVMDLPLRQLRPEIRGEILEEKLTKTLEEVRFRWGRHSTTRGNYAYASKRHGALRITWNPLVLHRWNRDYPDHVVEALLVDMILHEVSHLLDWIFCLGWGHQRGWKAWAGAAHFVPFGRQRETNRIAKSAVLHTRGKERIMKSGVMKGPKGGWIWKCAEDGVESQQVFSSRTKARESYKIHRQEICDGERDPKPKKAAKGQTPSKPKKVTKGTVETLWRLGTIVNPRTQRETTLKLRKDGLLIPSDIERTGLKRVDEWYEVRATSRTEALALIAQGKAEKMKHKK